MVEWGLDNNLLEQLYFDLSSCQYFSIALDESVNIQGKPQLAVFIIMVSKSFIIKEELLSLINLGLSTTGKDIKKALDYFLRFSSVLLSKLVSIATDRAQAMVGTNIRLIGMIKKDTQYPKILPVQCIIHCEA